MKCYVVGDIHGCLSELASLVESLPLEHGDTVVFLGDYIDRGPDSKGVIDYLADLRGRDEHQTVFLKGNHEDMMLSYMGLSGRHGDAFLLNGGLDTLASYGVGAPTESPGAADGQRLLAALPPGHVEFLVRLDPWYFVDGFLCVHAGINPGRPWDEQIGEELIWIRHEFIVNPHPLPQTVLFGHTPMREVFFNLPYKIGLDTGLVYGNALSCLEVTGRTLYQIRNGAREVSVTDVSRHWERIGS
ncbi:MAG: metallophosphoesterase family protein [Deltaproteobacteria bacterium]|nr:metallophosphoesterase family protein [Deltaproteobacteria bacterium]